MVKKSDHHRLISSFLLISARSEIDPSERTGSLRPAEDPIAASPTTQAPATSIVRSSSGNEREEQEMERYIPSRSTLRNARPAKLGQIRRVTPRSHADSIASSISSIRGSPSGLSQEKGLVHGQMGHRLSYTNAGKLVLELDQTRSERLSFTNDTESHLEHRVSTQTRPTEASIRSPSGSRGEILPSLEHRIAQRTRLNSPSISPSSGRNMEELSRSITKELAALPELHLHPSISEAIQSIIESNMKRHLTPLRTPEQTHDDVDLELDDSARDPPSGQNLKRRREEGQLDLVGPLKASRVQCRYCSKLMDRRCDLKSVTSC